MKLRNLIRFSAIGMLAGGLVLGPVNSSFARIRYRTFVGQTFQQRNERAQSFTYQSNKSNYQRSQARKYATGVPSRNQAASKVYRYNQSGRGGYPSLGQRRAFSTPVERYNRQGYAFGLGDVPNG